MRSKRWLHICLAVIFSLSGRALAVMANTTTTITKEDSITANTTATRCAAGITARMMIVCHPG